MNRQLAISYHIAEFPNDYSFTETLKLFPIVVLNKDYEQNEKEKNKRFTPPKEISMQKRPQEMEDIFQEKNVFYKKLQRTYRANQERIISDIICGIIIQELRNEKNSDIELTFFITAKFDTNKIVGRLAYLNLPLDRVTILFISRNLIDLYSHNIISPFDNKVDLSFLCEKANPNSIYGPYPEDDTMSLLRTFYKTYEKDKFYPVKIDLFSQGLITEEIIRIKEKINKDYLSLDNTETMEVFGLMDNTSNKTRLPKILVDCENVVKKLKMERL